MGNGQPASHKMIPTKKLKDGFEIPAYGLGTWQMGGREKRDPKNDDAADIVAIQDAIEHGVTHIDTAEVYAGGYAEELIGRAIKDFDRSKLLIASKVHAEHLGYDQILEACKRSLRRLATPYLDLYLLHRYNADVSLEKSMQALDVLVSEGLVRNIGVCNFGAENLQRAQSYTKNKVVCDQVHYNLIYREPERAGLLEYCQNNDIFLSAWRPTQYAELAQKIPLMEELCEKYQKTPIQIAINWLVSQDHVITLSKTRSIEHLKENIAALDWQMESADIEQLRKEYPDQQAISNRIPLDK